MAHLPRPTTPPGVPPLSAHHPPSHICFGVVCSSNINRSMEAHLVLTNAGLRCASYGTGTTVRLPGRTAMEPRIFKFGTPYRSMYSELAAINEQGHFTRNGVLGLCRRGAAVKPSPTRWQDTADVVGLHRVVICFEERIYDAVTEDLQLREPEPDSFRAMHVICLDTKDNPQEAHIQGQVCLDLCWRLERAADNLDAEAADIVEAFQQEREAITPIKVLYQVFYL